MKKTNFVFKYRVSYADTDKMGYAYYANYFVWFERARTELLRNMGMSYKNIEEKGFALPVSETSCAYYKPIYYDDELEILTAVDEFSRASLSFKYEIKRDGIVLTKAYSKHPFIDKSGKPVRIIEELETVLS